ncbi:glutathione transferase Ure2p class [Trametes coccinea BRFM310]|uniref:glutathione transferase n=1 Tax=Trametes coccinea (strain BRFM310) TaxID=1353009 RepID=A0A1Y2IKL4_TRAC3|nr:glutathione transferase Ure2p class [Trametes coccinea BRFM310]
MAQPHFTLYSHKFGPNGWKVAIVLEELGLEYESLYLDFQKQEQKSPEHLKHNPNGRIPTLIDHKNNDFAIWESDAILLYLVEKYDPEGKISVTDFQEKMQLLQWLFFQASGQGPYFGQVGYFKFLHHEPLPGAIERYQKEMMRVFGVLESVLSEREWLVGNKFTIADLSFIPWNIVAVDKPGLLKDYEGFHGLEQDFPAVSRWHNAILVRPTVKKVYEVKDQVNAEGH